MTLHLNVVYSITLDSFLHPRYYILEVHATLVHGFRTVDALRMQGIPSYAPRLWNELHVNIKAADSVQNFKKQLKKCYFERSLLDY